jgi:TetR/AcrR family transcriptional regulator
MARPKIDDPEARAKILAAAERLFAERGYAGAAIREIASEAGINSAMIHYYFGNKDGLYFAVLENAASTVRALIAEATGGDQSIKERLTSFVSAYASYLFSHPNLARILSREMLSGGDHSMKLAQKYATTNYGMLREAMAAAIKRGEMRKIDVDLAPVSLMGMILVFQFMRPLISFAIGNLEYDERFIKRLSAHTVDLFLNGAAGVEKKAASVKRGRNNKRPLK